MASRTELYADAVLLLLTAEEHLDEVADELFRFSQTFQGNDELRTALTDARIPASRRQQIVEDLLGGRASDLTVAVVSLMVGAGRAREIPEVAQKVIEASAASRAKSIAEVRSAVELSDDQKARLAEALKAATGQDVDVKVVIDPTVIGGLVTTIGDTVIDGSVRTRLAQLRDAF